MKKIAYNVVQFYFFCGRQMIVTNLRPWWHLTAEDWIQWTSHPGFVHFNFFTLMLMMAAWQRNN